MQVNSNNITHNYLSPEGQINQMTHLNIISSILINASGRFEKKKKDLIKIRQMHFSLSFVEKGSCNDTN